MQTARPRSRETPIAVLADSREKKRESSNDEYAAKTAAVSVVDFVLL
ncbi:hypothetical protein [Halogranum rubrum]|nr:hypothetical protein [Halogranum rubrum]